MHDDGKEIGAGGGTVGARAFRVFSTESLLARRASQIEAAMKQVMEYPHLLAELTALLRVVYPPHVVAVVAGWGLRTATGPDGVRDDTMIPGISQHHAELLQAIVLTTPAHDWGRAPADPTQIQDAINLVTKLADAFLGRRRLDAEALTDPQERTQRGLQERLRVHTQMVRNWGPYEEMLRILRGLYAPLDEPFRCYHGFGVLDVIMVAEQTVAAIENQVNDRFRLLKSIFRASDIHDLVTDFYARYPGVAGHPDDVLSDLPPGASVESVRARLLVHADRWLVVNAIAPVEAIAKASGIPGSVVRTILDRLSLTPGALQDRNLDHLFLDNPVWTRPGIKTGDQYFFAFPQTSVSFLHEILRPLCEEAGLKSALEERRAGYLELETVRIIKDALPGARIIPGAVWPPYETDLLAHIDRVVLIVECKSATLTPQGLRGAPDRARRHVGELIAEPSIQSARLKALLLQARAGDEVALTTALSLGLEPHAIDDIIRISVTLDDLSVLSSAEADLKAAAWIPEDLELAATLNLADLACVADILPRPCQFLHYFSERSQVQKAADIFGFELDFLGLYLATAFALDDAETHGRLDITAMSQAIDRYYHNRQLGLAVDKPAPRMATMFAAILDQLETRRPAGWTTMALDLLSLGDADDQTECVALLEDARKEVLEAPQDPDRLNVVARVPPGERDTVLAFHVFPYMHRSRRNDVVRGIAQRLLDESDRSRCLVVSRMIETWEDDGFDAIALVGTTV